MHLSRPRDHEVIILFSYDSNLFFSLTLTIGQGPQLITIAVEVHEEVSQIWLK